MGLASANIYIRFNCNDMNTWTEKCVCIDQSQTNIRCFGRGVFRPNSNIFVLLLF